jgi:hypothetical protein
MDDASGPTQSDWHFTRKLLDFATQVMLRTTPYDYLPRLVHHSGWFIIVVVLPICEQEICGVVRASNTLVFTSWTTLDALNHAYRRTSKKPLYLEHLYRIHIWNPKLA